jgi:ComF family protein
VYREGSPVARAVQRWKYDRDEVLGGALALLFREAFDAERDRHDRIVPVPADPRRLRSRGFNPALVLARAIASRRGMVVPALLRRPPGRSQVGRGRREREARALDVEVARGSRIAGSSVLLVDDVYTTGATATGCARALLAAGAAVVDVRTLAHTAPPGDG